MTQDRSLDMVNSFQSQKKVRKRHVKEACLNEGGAKMVAAHAFSLDEELSKTCKVPKVVKFVALSPAVALPINALDVQPSPGSSLAHSFRVSESSEVRAAESSKTRILGSFGADTKSSKSSRQVGCQHEEFLPPGKSLISGGGFPLTQAGRSSHSEDELLYLTLVQDGALPPGHSAAFQNLAEAARSGTERLMKRKAHLGNTEAAVYLHEWDRARKQEEKQVKRTEDQFAAAATLPPRRFKAKYQQRPFQGPSARKDAEEAERARWIQNLANLLRGTDTPMGKLLSESAGNVQFLGEGKRASTLRARVRGARKFLAWLAVNHQQIFPTAMLQLVGFLQVRLSEPCNRGGLKGAHRSFVFLEEMAGIAAEDRITSTQLYNVAYRELLTSALPGRPSKQAPRFPVASVAALEELVQNTESHQYFRVFGWWLLLQNWATLRFCDHRGILPSSVLVQQSGFTAKLTRSKTLGEDKSVLMRRLVVDSCAFIQHKDWMTTGWSLLRSLADFPRDYLLPAPSDNMHGCRRVELKYDLAFAVQSRVLASLSVQGATVQNLLALLDSALRSYLSPVGGSSTWF